MSNRQLSPIFQTCMVFIGIALLALIFADIEIVTRSPGLELSRMMRGFLTPSLNELSALPSALAKTVAFAVLGVSLSSICGFALALVITNKLVQWGCAFVRSIHELFWALIFLQFLGFHPLTGILAIAVPYTGVFAKVYAEILEENQHRAFELIRPGKNNLSRFFYSHFTNALPHLRTYTLYRFECGLRSSTILGFVGIPTLGFYLESNFMQGSYSEVATLLLLFYGLIITLKYWLTSRLFIVYLIAAPFLIGPWSSLSGANFLRFFTVDVIPAPLRNGDISTGLTGWITDLLLNQAIPGLFNTFILTQIVLLTTAVLALLLFPVGSEKFTSATTLRFGRLLLVTIRSTPEYILAFVFLLLWGPSLLPAIFALTLHNGAVIGHLIGQASNHIKLRPDHSRGVNLYAFEIVPRIFSQLLAFLFYRWEIIFRESAILGILGIHTLGFYIESSIEEIHFDQALILILVTALVNIFIDQLSRKIRHNLRRGNDTNTDVYYGDSTQRGEA